MEAFTITTRMTGAAYAKVMVMSLFKKPVFLLAVLLGLFYLATVTLDYFNIIDYYTETPWFEICCGLFLLLLPGVIVLIALRQLNSNPSLGNGMVFTFDEQGVSVQGVTFKSEFLWAHIIKQREIGKYLILYHSSATGNYIDKTTLTADQLNFIKTKIGKK